MTALPHTGSKPRELVHISTDLFEITIKGVPENKRVNHFSFHQEKDGKQQLASFSYSSKLQARVQVYDPFSPQGLVEYRGNGMYPCFFEQNNYEVVIQKKQGCPDDLALGHMNRALREAVTPAGPGSNVLSGIINFGDEVGSSRFEITGEGFCYLSFELEVFPGKLDYQEDFFKLLQEVNEEVYNLAFDFLMKTQMAADLKRESEPSPAEYFSILKTIFKKLLQALEQIKRSPYQEVVPVNRVVRPEKAKKADAATTKWLASRPHLFEKTSAGLSVGNDTVIPRKVLDRKKERTFDTYENRFLKWTITRMVKNLKSFLENYKDHCRHQPDPALLEGIGQMQKRLLRYLRLSFLREVGKLGRFNMSSLVMQMAPGYREVFKYHLMLQKGLNVQSDIFNISLKNTAELYEYWCFLKLNSLMRKKYSLQRNGLIQLNRKGITVTLKKGKESEVQFVNPKNGERFSLIYNRFFTNLPTTAQKPDNVLVLEKEGSNTIYHYVFDAKYRLTVDEDYIRNYHQPGPPEDTINAMHRYRDAILSTEELEESYNRRVFGAFVLFPHNDEQTYAGNEGGLASRFYTSIDSTGIGALPFLPSQTILVETLLEELFLETPQTAFERTLVQEGTVEYFETEKEKKNLLIGPLSKKEQLDVCLENNMYYTYLDKVQSHLSDLEYVAIYQSKRMFRDSGQQGIFFYGKIRRFVICKRKEIKEMPPEKRNEDKLAVKFFVGQWERKEPPIAAAGYGPSIPQRARWSVFKAATIYPELHLDPLEIRLWRELRRMDTCLEIRFPKATISSEDRPEQFVFPGLAVVRENDSFFHVQVNGQKKRFSFHTLQKRTGKTLRDIVLFWKTYR